MTHPVIATSITAELTSYCEVVKRDWAWPAPAAGFAAWLYNRRNLPAPFTPPEVTALACIDDGRLGEAPVLAAYGYLLAAADEPDEGAAATWISGIARLSTRDPLPGDRASFFFRPVELLGLALGAAAVTRHDTEPRRWLRQVIKDGGPRLGRDSRSWLWPRMPAAPLEHCPPTPGGSLHRTARRSTSQSGGSSPHRPPTRRDRPGSRTTPMKSKRGCFTRCSLPATPTSTLPTPPCCTPQPPVPVGTGLARAGHGRQAALHTVLGVLRRFPAIVRELNKRHNGRTPLADIKDEYDVQDLLRGVLSGLFDDIRDEEYTPSHASLTSRVDLLLKREQIVIEAKMTRVSLGQRKVAEELAIDKELYRSHPDCKTLVCFVYDPARHLNNPTGLEDDLTDHEGHLPTVVVVAH